MTLDVNKPVYKVIVKKANGERHERYTSLEAIRTMAEVWDLDYQINPKQEIILTEEPDGN